MDNQILFHIGDPSRLVYLVKTNTILGYTVRRDTLEKQTRVSKVYELRGSGLLYLVDYFDTCQAGKFSHGQVVQFRVDSDNDPLFQARHRS